MKRLLAVLLACLPAFPATIDFTAASPEWASFGITMDNALVLPGAGVTSDLSVIPLDMWFTRPVVNLTVDYYAPAMQGGGGVDFFGSIIGQISVPGYPGPASSIFASYTYAGTVDFLRLYRDVPLDPGSIGLFIQAIHFSETPEPGTGLALAAAGLLLCYRLRKCN